MLSDCTAVCQGVAWEDQFSVLKVYKSYKLKAVTARSFNQAKYVSLGEHATIEVAADTGEVENEVVAHGQSGAKVVEGEIVAAIGCDAYRSYRSCKAKCGGGEQSCEGMQQVWHEDNDVKLWEECCNTSCH